MTDTSQHTALNDRLRHAFLTSNSDLEANRDGQIAPSQRARLEEKRNNRLMVMLGGFALMALFSCALIAFGSPTNKRYSPSTGVLGLFLIVPFLGLAVAYDIMPLSEEINNPQMASAQGQVTRNIVWNRTSKQHQVRIDGQGYQVDEAQYNAFKDGETYILYHTARSKTVLAAEHVSDNPDSIL